ncbi:family 2 glycosyl transferase [Leptolyngbya boryana NIES-2135]|uniref:Family 2 glycosyl transferase n=1 Tax=Leptolyngbya boryana NIES-2135 TaxID=1973484 RepID=A0A1Z4JLF1_LEPBY|nr:glycosyltransferase family 2 protein [Leptolyngbya boryana]MBD2367552.1 glycosyltransferase family 2 protein [Leptolyngbya sp. FACHB-161]MBD2374076.1 glycosyltransferase family 2 protein [Leptolyngbya sp. FACHB-238]MBD2398701.1 glycosyltransferase family 2 protein [Leptolyngbya sp. FACHB-239]MBD2404925.1 glycosyltransferase family 2 protein [Leptolyngbya sp. FACHB-402]BAY57595.1 family 2 glycosyl transferase [Leptolyngbya boryana NIES-2135]
MSAAFNFSIVLETENLETADLAGLLRSLASLEAQDPPPTAANEVLLIDSGDIPETLLAQLCQQYPWIKVCPAPPGTEYYQAKMLGAELATGEIIVYYDSDCIYAPDWMRKILDPFSQPEIQVVAGETTTNGVGIYGTAMALGYIFPQYSGRTELTSGKSYFLNNVAFRRSFLLSHPIPTDLPLYRGNCAVHAHELVQSGVTIWQQPLAQVLHSPPNGLDHFFWRFLLIGHDYYWQKKLIPTATNAEPTMSGIKGKLEIFIDRIRKMRDRDIRHLVFLPLSLPVVLISSFLIYIGYSITTQRPHYLLKKFNQHLNLK